MRRQGTADCSGGVHDKGSVAAGSNQLRLPPPFIVRVARLGRARPQPLGGTFAARALAIRRLFENVFEVGLRQIREPRTHLSARAVAGRTGKGGQGRPSADSRGAEDETDAAMEGGSWRRIVEGRFPASVDLGGSKIGIRVRGAQKRRICLAQ